MKGWILGLQLAIVASVSLAQDDGSDSAQAFDIALRQALESAEVPFSLAIKCTDDKGVRSLSLHDSGFAIWGNQAQVNIDKATREALLQTLLDAGFSTFDTHYGGKPGSGRMKAPIIIMCAVEAQVGGVDQASYQDVNGERSEALMTLAAQLLDRMEPLAAGGVRSDSLEQGLQQLSTGELAPEALFVRVMFLPADESEAGQILQIENGELARQSYQPGVEVGDWETQPLNPESLARAIEVIQAATYSDLPRQLKSDDRWQVEVRVLNHSHAVHARNVSSASIAEKRVEAEALNAMANELLALPVTD